MLMLSSLCASALTFEYGSGKYETNGVTDPEYGYPQVVCTGVSASSSSYTTLNLRGVVEYNNVKYRCIAIGTWAFYDNNTVETVNLGYGIAEIRSSAFQACSNLTNVRIPSSVKTIGNYAFYGAKCSSVDLARVPESTSLPTFGTDCFTSIYYLNSSTLAASDAAKADPFLKTVVKNYQRVPRQAYDYALTYGDDTYYFVVTKAPTKTDNGESALVGVSGTTIELDSYSDVRFRTDPSNIICTSIPKTAFKDKQAGSITSVKIGQDIEIADSAFINDTKLTSLSLSGGCKVGTKAFAGCTALQNLTMMGGSIGNYAFSGCSSLSGTSGTLTLGGSAWNKLSINGNYAFEKIPVNKVFFEKNVDVINPTAFVGCLQLREYEVSADNPKYSSYNTMLFDKGQTKLVSVPTYFKQASIDHGTLPNTVTEIGERALQGNTKVWYMYVPYGVTKIGDYAFDSSSLISLNIPSSVTSFGYWMTYGCNSLKYIGLNKKLIDLPNKDVFYLGNNKYFSGTFYYPVRTHYTLSETDKDDSDYEKYKYYVDAKKEYGAFDLISYIDGNGSNPLCYNLDKSTHEAVVVPGKFNGTFLRPTATTINIPASVSTRGEDYTVTRLGNAAFINNTTVTTINVPNSVRVFDGYFDYKWYKGTDGVTDPLYSSWGAPDKPRDGFQFYGCTNLTNVKLPSGLECVPYSCFRKTKVKNVILPYGVQIIAGGAFQESAVETLLVPSSVKRFSGYELQGATKLKTLFLNVPYDKLGDADGKGSYEYRYYTNFGNSMPSNMNVYIPASEAVWSGGTESITANDKWKNDNLFSRHKLHIGAFDFYANNGTNQVYLTVTDAEKRKCKYVFVPSTYSLGIKSVTIGDVVTDYYYPDKQYTVDTMDPYAFLNCTSLSEVKLNVSLYNIPAYAFCGTTSLKSFPFQDSQCQSLKTIGSFAFEGSGLSGSVVLPGENLTGIGAYAFGSCKSLNKLYVRYHPNFTVNTDYPIFDWMNDNFVCYVDHRRFPYYYRTYTGFDTSSTNYSSRLQPFLNPSCKWTTASFPKLFDSKGKAAANYTVSLSNVYKRGGKVYALGTTTPSQPGTIVKTEVKASGNSGAVDIQGYLIEAEPGSIIDLSTTNTTDLKVTGNQLKPSAMALAATGGQIALTSFDYQYCRDNGVYTVEPSNGSEPFLTMQDKYDGGVGEAYVFFNPHPELNTIKIVDEGTEPGPEEHLKGDVNEDKKVDISDIVAVINHIAGSASYKYANVNGDKNVDISDIVAIINIIAAQ